MTWRLALPRPALVLLLSVFCFAGYINFTGDVDAQYHTLQGTTGYDDFDRGSFESADNQTAYLFAERQQVTLGSNLTIDTATPGTYTSTNEPSGATITSGTEVDSYLLHFDPDADGFSPIRTSDGTVTFDVDILGVICGQTNLINSDFLAVSGTSFQTNSNYRGTVSGSEPAGDSFTLSADLRTITFHFETRSTYMEQLRIITEGTSTVPVTPASFKATPTRRGVEFQWSTATEAGNAGFHIYQQTERKWIRVNQKLIPSHNVDGLTPSAYSHLGENVKGVVYRLADVDIFGTERFHGPFNLGESYGRDIITEPIDWRSISQQHDLLEQSRLNNRRSRVESLINDHRNGLDGPGFAAAEVHVNENGIQRITYAALQAAGINLAGVDGDSIAITLAGQPIPIRVGGLTKNLFGPKSFVEFVGEAGKSLYTDVSVYQLQIDPFLAQRIQQDHTELLIDVAPVDQYWATTTVADDLRYSLSSPNGDPWYQASMLTYTTQNDFSFDIQLDKVRGGQATLSVDLWGVTNWPAEPDHRVITYVNGVQVDNAIFDGLTEEVFQIELPTGLIQEGTNQITFSMPGDTGVDYDLVNLEGFAISYQRTTEAQNGVLDFVAAGSAIGVSGLAGKDVVIYRLNGEQPVQLTRPIVQQSEGSVSVSFVGQDQATRYLVASSEFVNQPVLKAPRPPVDITSGRADLLIISHPDFIDGLAPLVSARQNDGFVTKVIDVEDIYAQFGSGVIDANAIKNYITYASSRLRMSYVLLVGGDTYDYFDRLGLGSVSFIPSPYAQNHEVVFFAPVDPLYTDLDGDNAPDLPIGRFPVRTQAELQLMIQKTLLYPNADHQGSAVFASDRTFSDASSTLSSQLPPNWAIDFADVDTIGVASARAALLASLNDGVALTSFFGHSGPTIWTFDGLFEADDCDSLTNFGEPTVVTQWGCWNTYHVEPRYNTLGHKFLLSGSQGAAAVLGSVSLTDTSSDRSLGNLVLNNMLQPGETIGDAIQDAKNQLQQTHPGMDVILGWTLLGDPTLMIHQDSQTDGEEPK